MKTVTCIASIASIAALLTGCASGPGYMGHRPGMAVIGYDGWYDGRYGAIHDGYWRDGHFWWRDNDSHPYQRDDGNHFRHDPADGFQHIHGESHGGEQGADHGPDRKGGPG